MQIIPIRLPAAYAVHVGHGCLAEFPAILRSLGLNGRLLIVTDGDVSTACLPAVQAAFQAQGRAVESHVIPAGERSKSMAEATRLWNRLLDEGHSRSSVLLALGGGVVSDLTGFVASSFMRGIAYVNMPTSMMGQLDAAIGGKTAVNFPQAKNCVGAFYQPRAVLSDTAFLKTLPRRELSSGLAEAVKYGLLIGDEFFARLERHAAAILANDAAALTEVLAACIRYKAGLVEIDERDQKERMVLNLGHTLGHALEKLGNYDRYRHGEAVAIGLCFAMRIAEAEGVLRDAGLPARVQNLLRAFGLDTRCPEMPVAQILDTIRLDKKVTFGDSIRFILSVRAGEVAYREIPLATTREYLAAFAGGAKG